MNNALQDSVRSALIKQLLDSTVNDVRVFDGYELVDMTEENANTLKRLSNMTGRTANDILGTALRREERQIIMSSREGCCE